jgi:hypothetical protein
VRSYGACGREHIAQVRRTVLVWRGTYGYELEKSVFHTPRRVRREFQAAGLRVALDKSVETRLVNRNLATAEALNLAGVDIDANDVIARIGKTSSSNEAHITGAENRNAHLSFLSVAAGERNGLAA